MCFKKLNRKVKFLRLVRVVNCKLDYEEMSSDNDKYVYNIKI